jgi:hypothetical protein
MLEFKVDKFNYLPRPARMAFGGFVKKLQDEMEYLKHVKKATKGPLQGTYSYCIDKALTVEELNKVMERFRLHDSGQLPLGIVTSQNSDGSVNVAVNMNEGVHGQPVTLGVDKATGRLDNTLLPMEFEESGETLDGDVVFEKRTKIMSPEDIYKSMLGQEMSEKLAKGLENLGKPTEEELEDDGPNPFIW